MSRERPEPTLIDSLVAELRPVRPVSYARIVLGCLVVEAVVAVVALWAYGVRPDLGTRLGEPGFLAVLATLCLAAVGSAAVAVRSAIPGREARPSAARPLLAVPIVLTLLVLLFAPWGRAWPGWSRLVEGCWSCVGLTFASGVVPWIITVAVLSRLAPLRELRSGLFAGFAAFLVGALVTELHCPVADSYHLAFAHYLPIALLSCLTATLAVVVLRGRPRAT